MSKKISGLLKEPLIHFLIGALLVFAILWATGSNRDVEDYTISVEQSEIDRLRANWIQNFRRPPTDQELDALIDQEIAEEIYYREALRLGMDRDDAVIRRRLYNKMRFLDGQDAEQGEPSDQELQEWMEQNPEKYSLSASYDFQQVYLGQGDELADKDIQELAKKLNEGAVSPADISKAISLPKRLNAAETETITRQFGEAFSRAINDAQTGEWVGPISSGFGQHLVKIDKKIPGKAAALDDVRQAVTNDWRAAQKAEQEREALEKYRSQYDINVAGRE